MTHGYRTRKAAQVSAFFALKEGGKIAVLKLAKLLYIADRSYLDKYDLPILFDNFVSMNHGPVTSMTLDHINGYSSDQSDWEPFISGRENYHVGLTRDLEEKNLEEDLDELSRSELLVLNEVWDKFGGMNQYQIRDWTHNNCSEWEDPHGSSNPIPYERVLKFLGKKSASEIAENIEDICRLDDVLSHAL